VAEADGIAAALGTDEGRVASLAGGIAILVSLGRGERSQAETNKSNEATTCNRADAIIGRTSFGQHELQLR
jgi:hypothetical protein